METDTNVECSHGTVIRTRTLTSWAKMLTADTAIPVTNLDQLSDGVSLTGLVEILAGRSVGKHMYRRRTLPHVQVCDHIEYVLAFLRDDGLQLDFTAEELIDAGPEWVASELVWPLLMHYSIHGLNDSQQDVRQYHLSWLNNQLSTKLHPADNLPIAVRNLSTDWNDGLTLGALVNSLHEDLCADWSTWSRLDAVENIRRAQQDALRSLGVLPHISPEDLASPHVDDVSAMTYLHQFIKVSSTMSKQQKP